VKKKRKGNYTKYRITMLPKPAIVKINDDGRKPENLSRHSSMVKKKADGQLIKACKQTQTNEVLLR
jgi:hypothetical protein